MNENNKIKICQTCKINKADEWNKWTPSQCEKCYWENAFTIFGKTLEELEFMLFQERENWKKDKIWRTNPHNVENIEAAIKHLRKTGEVRTTKNFYT